MDWILFSFLAIGLSILLFIVFFKYVFKVNKNDRIIFSVVLGLLTSIALTTVVFGPIQFFKDKHTYGPDPAKFFFNLLFYSISLGGLLLMLIVLQIFKSMSRTGDLSTRKQMIIILCIVTILFTYGYFFISKLD